MQATARQHTQQCCLMVGLQLEQPEQQKLQLLAVQGNGAKRP
jgi:hypothetical protein